MSQCVPSWGFNGGTSATTRRAQFNSNLFIPHVPSMLDEGHEVAAEIMWEKGELVLQDLSEPVKTMPILFPSPENNNFRYAFDKPRAGGTLESVVNQGTRRPVPQKVMAKSPVTENLFPWFYSHGGDSPPPPPAPPPNLTAMDAMVPCSAGHVPDSGEGYVGMSTAGFSAGVGSCSGKGYREGRKRRRSETREESSVARVPSSECSDSFDWESGEVSLDTTEIETETGTLGGFTSTSMTCGSPENTSSADQNCSTDEYDSACQSRTQKREVKRSRRVEKLKKSSNSTQMSMTASSTQNQSSDQRRRRDKIEQRMVTLQKMVPNSNYKIDKVAILDEVIEHLKQLQSQVEMMNRMNMVVAAPTMHDQMMLNMMMMMGPTGFMGMGPTGFNMGMGVGMGALDLNAFPRPNMTSSVPTRPHSFLDFMNMTTSIPFLMHQQPDPMSMFLAYQSQQLNTMDGYGRMAAFFNQSQLKRPS